MPRKASVDNVDITQLSHPQKNLLMYLETCLVDKSGRVDYRKIHRSAIAQLKEWADAGFISYGRIVLRDITREGRLWVTFSEAAWQAAHQARREMADKLQSERPYMITDEKKN